MLLNQQHSASRSDPFSGDDLKQYIIKYYDSFQTAVETIDIAGGFAVAPPANQPRNFISKLLYQKRSMENCETRFDGQKTFFFLFPTHPPSPPNSSQIYLYRFIRIKWFISKYSFSSTIQGEPCNQFSLQWKKYVCNSANLSSFWY